MTNHTDSSIDAFLAHDVFAVAGASEDRAKYGNKTLRVYIQNHKEVFPLNPKGGTIEGLKAYSKLGDIPKSVGALSIVTPPAITKKVVDEALALGIKHLWMQPGAENDDAIQAAKDQGANVIFGGPCVLVALGYHE